MASQSQVLSKFWYFFPILQHKNFQHANSDNIQHEIAMQRTLPAHQRKWEIIPSPKSERSNSLTPCSDACGQNDGDRHRGRYDKKLFYIARNSLECLSITPANSNQFNACVSSFRMTRTTSYKQGHRKRWLGCSSPIQHKGNRMLFCEASRFCRTLFAKYDSGPPLRRWLTVRGDY